MAGFDDFEEMERLGWGDPEIAVGYADGFAFATRRVAQALAVQVRAGAEARVLDLCSGHGVVADALVESGAKVTGLDFSAPMVDLAKARVPGAEFVEGDATATGFADEGFDGVTIGFGIPHLPDPHAGLTEAFRLLRPGGRLAFSIWYGAGSDGAFGWLFEAVGRYGDTSVTLPAGPDAHAFANPEIAGPALEAAGFSDVGVTQIDSEIFIAKPEHLFDVFDRGAVRAAALLAGQSAMRRDDIRVALAERVREFGVEGDGGWKVRAPAAMVFGSKP